MRLLLVGPELEENLSLRYLSSALLAAGHEVSLATFNDPRDTDRVLRDAAGADMVGLSMSFQVRAREFLALAHRLKEEAPGRRIVAGGHFASCAAEPLLRENAAIDLVVVHEGERTLVELANAGRALEERLPSIAGIVWRRAGEPFANAPRAAVNDLDTLAVPDRRGPVFMLAGVRTAYLLGSRGCFESCAYCCITTLHRLAPGKRFRQRRAEKLADEMASLYHERGVRQFVLHDDTFLVPSVTRNHARIDALQAALEARNVRDFTFTMKCRPADVDESVFLRLREMGLVRVFLGIETSTEIGLECLNRRQTLAEEEQALAICARVGVSAQFTIMIFHPDATFATVRQDIAFMRRHAEHPLNFCRAELYAGTPLEARMLREGRAHGSYLGWGYSLAEPAIDRACTTTLQLMADRLWSTRGLVNRAIGFNHLVAAARRFHHGDAISALARRASAFHRLVNSDTLDLLERIVDACENAPSASDARLRESLDAIQESEALTRAMLLAQLDALAAELATLTGRAPSGESPRARTRMHAAAPVTAAAAAAVLAMSLLGCTSHEGVSEMAAPPVDSGVGGGGGAGGADGGKGGAGGSSSDAGADGDAGD